MLDWIDGLIDNLPKANKGGLTFGWRTVMLIGIIAIYFSVRHFSTISEANHELLVSIAKNDSIRDVKLQRLISQNEATEEFHKKDLAEHIDLRSNITKIDGEMSFLCGYLKINRKSITDD